MKCYNQYDYCIVRLYQNKPFDIVSYIYLINQISLALHLFYKVAAHLKNSCFTNAVHKKNVVLYDGKTKRTLKIQTQSIVIDLAKGIETLKY